MSVCQVCHKKVVAFYRKIEVKDMVWHKKCCRCAICELQLSAKTVRVCSGRALCIKHCLKPTVTIYSPDHHENRNLDEERELPYFHDEVTREEAERRLGRTGDFLLRWSNSESAYYVSVMHTTQIHHVQIIQISKSEFKSHKDVVPTLREWVKRYTDTKTPILEKNVLLSNPIARENFSKKEVSPPVTVRYEALPLRPPSSELKFLRMSTFTDGICQISNDSICAIKANAIVNSVNLGVSLSGGALARAIAEAGGPEIQKELDAYRQRPSKTPTFGDVIVTRGYNLPCDYVFHTILKQWQDGQHAVQDLRQILRKIFQLADEKKVTSLAIPPIGTGILGYPKQVVAQVLYAEAAEYLDYHTDSSIDRIIFVVNGEMDLYEIFTKLQEEENNKEDPIYEEIIIPRDQKDTDGYYQLLENEFSKTLNQQYAALMCTDLGLQTFQYPKNWSLTKASERPYDLVELDPASSEYKEVVDRIVASDGEIYEKLIAKIHRIENGKSYQVYEFLKKLMIRANGNDITNERLLWHGTKATAVENIIISGFNKSYAGANATLYGKGVYFAQKFSYSAQPLYSPPERQFGLKHIFHCRVLTGNYCLGHKDLMEPEFLPDKVRRYDSAVDNQQDPSIFVVFEDYAAYPEYLISFYEDSSDYVNN